MHRDPVVEEIRDQGDRIAEECEGDVHRMAERFRREQAQHVHRVAPQGTTSISYRTRATQSVLPRDGSHDGQPAEPHPSLAGGSVADHGEPGPGRVESRQRAQTMVYKGIVHNGAVRLPPEAKLPDGMEVRIEPVARKTFADLLDLAGTWEGDDADRVVDEIYASRSSAPPRASLDS